MTKVDNALKVCPNCGVVFEIANDTGRKDVFYYDGAPRLGKEKEICPKCWEPDWDLRAKEREELKEEENNG